MRYTRVALLNTTVIEYDEMSSELFQWLAGKNITSGFEIEPGVYLELYSILLFNDIKTTVPEELWDEVYELYEIIRCTPLFGIQQKLPVA